MNMQTLNPFEDAVVDTSNEDLTDLITQSLTVGPPALDEFLNIVQKGSLDKAIQAFSYLCVNPNLHLQVTSIENTCKGLNENINNTIENDPSQKQEAIRQLAGLFYLAHQEMTNNKKWGLFQFFQAFETIDLFEEVFDTLKEKNQKDIQSLCQHEFVCLGIGYYYTSGLTKNRGEAFWKVAKKFDIKSSDLRIPTSVLFSNKSALGFMYLSDKKVFGPQIAQNDRLTVALLSSDITKEEKQEFINSFQERVSQHNFRVFYLTLLNKDENSFDALRLLAPQIDIEKCLSPRLLDVGLEERVKALSCLFKTNILSQDETKNLVGLFFKSLSKKTKKDWSAHAKKMSQSSDDFDQAFLESLACVELKDELLQATKNTKAQTSKISSKSM